jgi:hypothetical protein
VAFQSSATCADTGALDVVPALAWVVAAANAASTSAAATKVRKAIHARLRLLFAVVIV